jgi:Family of unknown function (DUF5990)
MEGDLRDLRLRLVLKQPPPGVEFGLQKGRGSIYETVQKRISTGKNLHFDIRIEVETVRGNRLPTLRGPFVQGSPGERFVYVDIGKYAGQEDSPWSRRLKVPLSGITSDMVERMSGDSHAVLEARVAGTGRDGGPNCATVKPFDGWKLTRRPVRQQQPQTHKRRGE